jgi:hypothetical protein
MLVHYLLVGKAGKTPAARDEARRLAEEAVAAAPGERWGYDARCEIAVATEDLKTLAGCTQKLRELAPDDRKTAYLGWWLALREGRYDDAEKVVDQAVTDGLDAASAANMRREIDTKRPLLSRVARHLPLGLGAGALAALVVLVVPRVARSLRSRQRQPLKRLG